MFVANKCHLPLTFFRRFSGLSCTSTLLIFPSNCKRTAIEVIQGNRRSQVGADIKRLAGGEGSRHGAFHSCAGRFLAVDDEHHLGRRAGLGDRGIHLDPVLARGELALGARDGAFDDHHVVLVDQIALVHIQREPAGSAAQRVEHPGSVIAELGIDGHMIALATQTRRGELGHAGRGRVKLPAGVRRLDAVLGMDAQPDTGADREHLVRFRFLQELSPSSLRAVWAPSPQGCLPAKSLS